MRIPHVLTTPEVICFPLQMIEGFLFVCLVGVLEWGFKVVVFLLLLFFGVFLGGGLKIGTRNATVVNIYN